VIPTSRPALPLSPSGAVFSLPDRNLGLGSRDWFAFV
jgi:hypothetical protein